MDIVKVLEILVADHIEGQMTDPQMLPLPETVAMLGGSSCGNIHERMLPCDVAKCIVADMAEMGILDQVREYFQNLDRENLLEETSLYEVMADLGEVDWK